MVDEGKRGVGSRDEGKHSTGRNDLLFVEKMITYTCQLLKHGYQSQKITEKFYDKPVGRCLRRHARLHTRTDRRTGRKHNASNGPSDEQHRYNKIVSRENKKTSSTPVAYLQRETGCSTARSAYLS